MMNKQKHFVLVHGADHGAWCWHKVTAGLKAAGNRVTTVDLAASGINMKKFEEVRTFQEYTEPLMEVLASLPAEEKVILVGHSLGGVSLAVAADVFPHKIAVAVFLAAFMPDTTHPPSYVLDQFIAGFPKGYHWLDTQISASACDPSNASRHLLFFGHEFMRLKLYQLCPPEDLELAKTLLRPGSMFAHDLSKASKFRNEGYGSVSRVYIVCKGDLAIPKEFQKWMIQNYGAHEVMEIEGADHMAMLSKPQQVCDSLSQIALQYA